jgi:two-component system LytT family response regulator
VKVLIVDDEPLARERIRTLLAARKDVTILGECGDGRSAARAIREMSPDLVFLDVQMPEMDGFAVLEELGQEALPAVIFVTAFDQYAIRAFEVCALDYLLKPFDPERFGRALDRARMENERREGGALREQIGAALAEWKQRSKYVDRLVVRTGGRVCFVRLDELDWVEAAGNYVRLRAGREEYLYRETISQLETRLPPEKFARIHRSRIVNVDRVKELHPLFHGDYAVILKDGQQFTLSKTYRGRLRV